MDQAKRSRTIVRLDSGGGSVADVNWLLSHGYQVHGKDYSGRHARHLAESVLTWIDDPRVAGRQVGWVLPSPSAYVRPVQRIAVRCRKQNGQWAVGVLLSALSPRDVLHLTGQPLSLLDDPVAVLLAYVTFYDQRGGGIETTFKGDKGVGMTKRNKKRFEAQQMVMLLGTLAHNVIIWARHWLLVSQPRLHHYGIVRMVRDVFHISGFLVMDALGQILQIVLNQDAPWAPALLLSLRELLAPAHVALILGQT
ncbi:MAG TPA: transposase [Ktedonobacteraceae bacterium]